MGPSWNPCIDLSWDECLTFSQALKRGTVRYDGRFGALIPDEIIVFTSTGTEAYRTHIGDMYEEDEYAEWYYANS